MNERINLILVKIIHESKAFEENNDNPISSSYNMPKVFNRE